MSDKKISELPVATAISASDISVLVDNGTDYQYTFTLLLQFLEANLITGANVSFGTILPQNTTGNNGDVFVNTSAGSFAQKIAGSWTVVYTLPAANGADGTLLYGAGMPGSSVGKNSDSYINTLTGIFYQKNSGAWSQVFSMATGPQGPQGPAGSNGTNGADGNSILFGTVDPSNTATGINGNFYVNTTTYKLFGPKTAGAWGTGVSLIGAGLPGGGAAGQILAKADGADFNTIWEDNSFSNLTGQPSDNANMVSALNGKVDKMTGFGLSSNDYTSTEKTKLASLTKHYQGKYSSLSALQTAIPGGSDGDYAIVVGSPNDQEYIWDSDHTSWVTTENIPASTFAALGGSPSDNASLNSALSAKENTANKDVVNGYAGLDGSGNFNKTTDNLNEGSSNLYFTAARVLAAILTGIGFATATAVLATDTILQAIGKLQAQISALFKIPAGGTAGQVLSKIDGTDGNTQWANVLLPGNNLSDLANTSTAQKNLGVDAVIKFVKLLGTSGGTYSVIGLFTSTGSATGYIKIRLEGDASSGAQPGYGPWASVYSIPISYWQFSGTNWYTIVPISINSLGFNWGLFTLEIQQTSNAPNVYTIRLRNGGGCPLESFNITVEYNQTTFIFTPSTLTGVDATTVSGSIFDGIQAYTGNAPGSNSLSAKNFLHINAGFGQTGSSSGEIFFQTQAATNQFNWNWPTSSGSSGQVLSSGGGGSAPMTWTTPNSDTINTAVDANYIVTSATQVLKLPVITAARTITLPTASSCSGQQIKIWNKNTSNVFLWTFNASVIDRDGTTTIAIANGTWVILESDGSAWNWLH